VEEKRKLTLHGRRVKSYVRGDYATDTVYTFLLYKHLGILFAKKENTTTRVADTLLEKALAQGLITETQLAAYTAGLCQRYFHKDQHPEEAPEDIYAYACRLRAQVLGPEAINNLRQLLFDTPRSFDPKNGIDQSSKRDSLLRSKAAAIFLMTQPELFFLMKKDIETAKAAGTSVYVCASPEGVGDLPPRAQLAAWLDNDPAITWLEADSTGIVCRDKLNDETACLMFYGEDGFLHCRSLSLDAVVTASPAGYHAQALCNQLGSRRDNVVYIPAGMDILPFVPLDRKTRLSYYHLAKLWEKHGDSIYTMSAEMLYRTYPEAFINIYDNENGTPMPLAVQADGFAPFDAAREQAVENWLGSFPNVNYTCAYFDEHGCRQPVIYDPAEKQPGILVHSVRISKAEAARVCACEKGVTPRQILARENAPGTALVSNFLFFLTPKLGTLYNDLRTDRPREQADAAAGHLDYMLAWQDGKRRETFPLFQKSCIAMTEEGKFLFFSFRLGGGCVTVNTEKITWRSEDIDPEQPGQVCVYTPFLSAADEDAPRETYRKTVGAGRVNFVILQDQISCIRSGDVVLPSVGVVLSLTEEKAAPLLSQIKPLEHGYYDPSGLSVTVKLDAPAQVDPAVWSRVRWAYGGGMSLIREGKGLCDGNDMESWFHRDGWMTPLSRQTQESQLHKLAKHPRTAMGITQSGELVILVYSGRTKLSSGADYKEMIHIARSLYPDIHTLMNVDGGGSAVLGVAHEGSFMELSYPATSSGSCAGMVRPIHTLFYIPIQKEDIS